MAKIHRIAVLSSLKDKEPENVNYIDESYNQSKKHDRLLYKHESLCWSIYLFTDC